MKLFEIVWPDLESVAAVFETAVQNDGEHVATVAPLAVYWLAALSLQSNNKKC